MMRVAKREKWQVIGLYALTEVLLYWGVLGLAPLTRVETLYQIDLHLLLRDRAVMAAIFLIALIASGAYVESRLIDRFDAVYFAWIGIAGSLVIDLLIVSLLPAEFPRSASRREIVFAAGGALPLVTAWRLLATGLVVRFPSFRRRLCVLDGGETGRRIANEIETSSSFLIGATHETFREFAQRRTGEAPRAQAGPPPPHDVLLVMEDAHDCELHEMLAFCELHCERISVYPSLEQALLFPHSKLSAVAGIPVIEIWTRRGVTLYTFVKRALDIVFSALGLLLSSPIWLCTIAALKLTTRDPVFYTQERLGMNGKPFHIYKFRSMRRDLELKNEAGHVLATPGDPRITLVGAFIRKHRIDEIPQLFNVLLGHMSLVGPRPVWKEFYDAQRESNPLFDRRLVVRPGLTSLSHVLGSYSSEPADRLRYDLVYINAASLVLDLRILVSTARIVLSGAGAR